MDKLYTDYHNQLPNQGSDNIDDVFDDDNILDHFETPNFNTSKYRVSSHARKSRTHLSYINWERENNNNNNINNENDKKDDIATIEAIQIPTESRINHNNTNGTRNLIAKSNGSRTYRTAEEAFNALTKDIKDTRSRDMNDDSWKFEKSNKQGQFKLYSLGYFHYIMDNAVRKLREYEYWNKKDENKKKKKKKVTFFFASKRFASEITSIGTFKQSLVDVGVDRKVIGTITQLSSNDHRRNYYTMEIKLGKIGIVNLFSAFLRRQAVLKMAINLYDPSKSRNFNDWNSNSLMHRADLVWQDEYQRNIDYYESKNNDEWQPQQVAQSASNNTTHNTIESEQNPDSNNDTNQSDNKSDDGSDDSSDDSDHLFLSDNNENDGSNNEESKSCHPTNVVLNTTPNCKDNKDGKNNDGDIQM